MKDILALGYDLPVSPKGAYLLPQIILSDLISIRKTILILQAANTQGDMQNILEQLIEKENVTPPHCSWSCRESILSRLKRYLLLASSKAIPCKESKAPLVSFQHYTESMKRQACDLYYALQGEFTQRQTRERISRLVSTSESCGRYYSAWIQFFKDNENILLYLLKKKKELEESFGHAFYEELVCGGFGTPGEISEFLLTRLHARGFDHYLPTVRKLLGCN